MQSWLRSLWKGREEGPIKQGYLWDICSVAEVPCEDQVLLDQVVDENGK